MPELLRTFGKSMEESNTEIPKTSSNITRPLINVIEDARARFGESRTLGSKRTSIPGIVQEVASYGSALKKDLGFNALIKKAGNLTNISPSHDSLWYGSVAQNIEYLAGLSDKLSITTETKKQIEDAKDNPQSLQSLEQNLRPTYTNNTERFKALAGIIFATSLVPHAIPVDQIAINDSVNAQVASKAMSSYDSVMRERISRKVLEAAEKYQMTSGTGLMLTSGLDRSLLYRQSLSLIHDYVAHTLSQGAPVDLVISGAGNLLSRLMSSEALTV